jgi:hypothetical protein
METGQKVVGSKNTNNKAMKIYGDKKRIHLFAADQILCEI